MSLPNTGIALGILLFVFLNFIPKFLLQLKSHTFEQVLQIELC